MPNEITNPQKDRILDKKVFPTSLSSKEIRVFWSDALKEKALFSARTTEKNYLDRVKKLLADYQTGIGETATGEPISQGTGRTRMLMREKLEELGLIEREDGSPNGNVVEKMTNLGSAMRLNLIIKTNSDIAHSYQQKLTAQDPLQKIIRPYFELVRNETRKQPRNWWDRWLDCANAVNWDGVVKGTTRMIAKVDSPIWSELGHRYMDSIGTDVPPFCFGSGMGWKSVRAKEIEDLGLEVG